jgi:hypothetical protein
MAQSVRDYFEQEWNRRLGVPTGRPIEVTQPENPSFQQRVPTETVQNQISAGTVDLSTNPENAYEDIFGEKAVGGGQSYKPGLSKYVNKDIRREQKQSEKRQKKAVQAYKRERARILAAAGEEGGGGWSGGFLSDLAHIGANVAGKPLEVGLEAISRPAYAAFEASRSWIEATQQEGKGGDWKPAFLDAITALDDASHGAALGIMGQKKTGFGQVVEEAAPNAPLPVKQALGLYGEIALDPLNLVTGASVGLARGTGKQLTKQGIESLAEQAAKKAINNSLDVGRKAINSPRTGRFVKPSEALSEAVADVSRQTAAQAVLPIQGGAKAGTVKLGGKINFADTVAQASGDAYRKTLLRQFEGNAERFRNHVERFMKNGKGTMSGAQVKALADADPYFRQLLNEIPAGQLNVSLVDKAAKYVRTTVNKEVEEFAGKMIDDLADFSYNAPGVRVAGKTIPFTRIGKAYDQSVGKALNASQRWQNFTKAVSYEKLFPGRLSLISQRVKSVGVENFDKFREEVRVVAKTVGKEDAKRIQHAIEKGIDLPDEHMNKIKDWVKEQYRRIWEDEMRSGVRNGDSGYIDNYTYVWMKGGSKRDINDFKIGRKKQIRGEGTAVGYTTQAAKDKGLRPVENAFEGLLFRQMKANRDITKSRFLHDLLDHYGFAGKKLSPDAVERRGLKQINPAKLNEEFRTALNTKHDAWYLPGPIHQVFRNYEDLAKFNDNGAFVRALRTITTKYKSIVTLPFPGYHIRNMIGDLYMGLLDGVKTRTYGEIFRKWIADKNLGTLVPKAGSTFTIGKDWTLSGDELWNLFKQNAGSGSFYRTDLGDTYNISWATQKMRDASQNREDFGRIAHFLHALRDEYHPGSVKNLKKAHETAVEKAVYRVNHYKFDYGALTKGEQQYAKLAMPFYTFTRKAVPTLAESLFLAPKNLSRPYRFMTYNDGTGAENFNNYLIPDWMQEIGYATISDEKEPWVITSDLLPTNALQNVPVGETSSQGFASNIVSQLNPFLTALPELAAGKSFYSGRENGSLPEYILNKLPPYTAARQLTSPNKPMLEKILGTRAGLGLGVRQVTKGQQEFRQNQLEDELIDTPFRNFNYGPGEAAGIRIYVSRRSEGQSYRVKESKGKERVLLDTMDLQEALKFAEDYAKGKK